MPTPFRGSIPSTDSFDFIVIDFPDPTNYSLGKLYTTAFYKAAARHLSAQGLMVVQSTSPMFARDSYWCIAETLEAGGTADLSLPRVRAVLRRVGIRDRWHAEYPRHTLLRRSSLCERRRSARALSIPA